MKKNRRKLYSTLERDPRKVNVTFGEVIPLHYEPQAIAPTLERIGVFQNLREP